MRIEEITCCKTLSTSKIVFDFSNNPPRISTIWGSIGDWCIIPKFRSGTGEKEGKMKTDNTYLDISLENLQKWINVFIDFLIGKLKPTRITFSSDSFYI